MQVTVLGKSPSWQDAGGACSGYLVEHDQLRLVLDCGNGVFGKLRSVADYRSVSDVLITHMHADHFLDLIPLCYGLANADRLGQLSTAGRPRVLYLPPDGRRTLRAVTGACGSLELIDEWFDVIEYDPADELTIAGVRVGWCEVPHYVRTFAVQLTAADGLRFTFGADCAPNDELVRFAHDTDLLMIEGTLAEPDLEPGPGHLTPRQAGEHAAAARAHRLLVTHYSDELDPVWVAAEAAAGYGGAVELAQEGAVYAVQQGHYAPSQTA